MLVFLDRSVNQRFVKMLVFLDRPTPPAYKAHKQMDSQNPSGRKIVSNTSLRGRSYIRLRTGTCAFWFPKKTNLQFLLEQTKPANPENMFQLCSMSAV